MRNVLTCWAKSVISRRAFPMSGTKARVGPSAVARCLARFAAGVGMVVLVALPAQAVKLTDLQFSSLPGGRVEVELQFDGTPPKPEAFTIEQPARIALTLPGVSSGLADRYHALGSGNARDVTVVQAGDRTRVVISLTDLVPFTTRVEGQSLFVEIGASGAAEQVSRSTATDTSVLERKSGDTSSGSQVLDVDFRRGEGSEGRVVVRLSNPRVPVNVTSESGKVKVTISNTSLPARLQRRLDVADFATPVQVVEARQQGNGVVLSIQPTGDFDYLAYQADDLLTITVKPVTPQEKAVKDEAFRYKGEKLSLNFQDIEVRSVLQLIADFTKLNLVAADTVSGHITLRLENVPWDQALDLILKTKGLDKRQIGNVLMVAPAAEIAAREKLELENSRQLSELAPLRTEFMQVRYANAKDLFALFGAGGGGDKGGGSKSMLSERGSAIVDERTNTIIVTETADKLAEIRRVLAQLDIPVRQVLIESRIVTASDTYNESLGISWGGGVLRRNGNTFGKAGGSLGTLTELQNVAAGGFGSTSTTGGKITSPDDLVVDLGVQGAGVSSIGIGITGPLFILDLELSALATDGVAEVVARPKVITADKKKATILSGVQIPYQEASSSGATSTQFKEAVLSLEVTPQITPDDRIIMDLKVNQDSVGQVFNGVPSINTNQISTQVLVDNGQTVVLGGIFTSDVNHSTTKTPFLGDLPYIGALFRRSIERSQKQEILIFITPRIMEDVLTVR